MLFKQSSEEIMSALTEFSPSEFDLYISQFENKVSEQKTRSDYVFFFFFSTVPNVG